MSLNAGNQTLKGESHVNRYDHHYFFGNCNVGSVTDAGGVIVTDGILLASLSNCCLRSCNVSPPVTGTERTIATFHLFVC